MAGKSYRMVIALLRKLPSSEKLCVIVNKCFIKISKKAY